MYFPDESCTKCVCGEDIKYYGSSNTMLDHECPLYYTNWFKNKGFDWLKADKAYWISIFKAVEVDKPWAALGDRWPYFNTQKTRNVCVKIRETRYKKRIEEAQKHLDCPIAQYGENFGRKVKAEIAAFKYEVDQDYVDNVRWAILDRRHEVERFKKDEGCCGRAHKIVTIMGRKVLLGFNYGH